jgi:hypothetical protein
MRSLALVASLLASQAAWAERAMPPRGFFRALVVAGARWTLIAPGQRGPQTVIAETYDVRKVGRADVARLRWSFITEGGVRDDEWVGESLPRQVAVTAAGVYLLGEGEDDASVLRRLKRPPTYRDPPRIVGAMTTRDGEYAVVRPSSEGPVFCFGEGPPRNPPPCEDVCFGEMCVGARGIVSIDARWAPNDELFSVRGFELLPR